MSFKCLNCENCRDIKEPLKNNGMGSTDFWKKYTCKYLIIPHIQKYKTIAECIIHLDDMNNCPFYINKDYSDFGEPYNPPYVRRRERPVYPWEVPDHISWSF